MKITSWSGEPFNEECLVGCFIFVLRDFRNFGKEKKNEGRLFVCPALSVQDDCWAVPPPVLCSFCLLTVQVLDLPHRHPLLLGREDSWKCSLPREQQSQTWGKKGRIEWARLWKMRFLSAPTSAGSFWIRHLQEDSLWCSGKESGVRIHSFVPTLLKTLTEPLFPYCANI